MSDFLQPHEPQHAGPPCPSPTPGVHSDSRPLSQWFHPAISSSVVPFSSCPQPLPALGSFPVSQLLAWSGQSIGVFSSSISPSNEHPGLVSFRMNWLDLLALSFISFCKGLQLPALLLDPSGCFFCDVIAPQGSKVLKGLEPGKLQVKHLLCMITFLVFLRLFLLQKKS